MPRSYRTALAIIGAGLLTFGVVFGLLQVARSDAAPVQILAPTPAATPPPIARSAESIAPRVTAGKIAVGVSTVGSEPLLRDVAAGDRLDVVASLNSARNGRPVTAVVVRGATVLRRPENGDPLLIEVAAPDAIVLAHLVLGGTRLGYSVWSASGNSPPPAAAMDEDSARALLGIVPTPSATMVPTDILRATAAPTDSPRATAVPASRPPSPSSGFLYQAQPDDTWDSVGAIFSLSGAQLRLWNEAVHDEVLQADTLLFIPRQGSL